MGTEENDRDDSRGIACPSCGCEHLFVQWTRKRKSRITRRRICRNCGRGILTRETIESDPDSGANVPYM